MYTIILDESNTLVTTVPERIMQRSKLVDSLRFLIYPNYKGIDMSTFTVTLEYLLPVSREYKPEILVRHTEDYNGWLDYRLPLDTCLTREAGDIELQLTFTKVELQPDGQQIQLVRKTSPTTITILPISAWSDIIADNALTALDQRLIQTQAMLEAANEFINCLDITKADNFVFDKDENALQLTSNGVPIGDKVVLPIGSTSGIAAIRIDDDGSLVVIYADGTDEIVGKVSGSCSGVYVPSLKEDVMTFTLSDQASEPILTFDIDQSNNWNEIEGSEQSSNYIWREL